MFGHLHERLRRLGVYLREANRLSLRPPAVVELHAAWPAASLTAVLCEKC